MRAVVLSLCLILAKAFCGASEAIPDEKMDPRLKKLLPETWTEYPAIEPAIPKDYVLGIMQTGDFILWGKAEDIKAFAKNPSASIKEPLFTVRQAYEIAQTGPDTFSGEQEIRNLLARQGVNQAAIKKIKWGEYPVLVMEGKQKDGRAARSAMIGLNNASRQVLLITFVSTKDERQSKEAWDKFLSATRPLTDRELFFLKGMDLNDGYTIYKEGDAKVKAIAEKRNSDRKIAVKVEPLTPETSFQILDIQEGVMSSKWKNGEPSVTLFGRLTEKSKKYGTLITDTVITVLLKNVDRFSFEPGTSEEH